MSLLFPKILVGNIRGIMPPMFSKNVFLWLDPDFLDLIKMDLKNENKKNYNK